MSKVARKAKVEPRVGVGTHSRNAVANDAEADKCIEEDAIVVKPELKVVPVDAGEQILTEKAPGRAIPFRKVKKTNAKKISAKGKPEVVDDSAVLEKLVPLKSL